MQIQNHDYVLNVVDTDSTSFSKQDGSPFTKEEIDILIKEVNEISPEFMDWENDGYFPRLLVVRAKNYVTVDEKGKMKIKGSGLIGSMKEPRLKDFLKEVITYLLYDKSHEIIDLYHQYIREINNLEDISIWSSKKTLTSSVLKGERTTEQKILAATQGAELQEGDKFHVYFTKDGSLKLPHKWDRENPDHDPRVLMKKLYDTLSVFETVLDMAQFTNYALKSHAIKVKLHEVLGLPVPEKVVKPRKNKLELNS